MHDFLYLVLKICYWGVILPYGFISFLKIFPEDFLWKGVPFLCHVFTFLHILKFVS